MMKGRIYSGAAQRDANESEKVSASGCVVQRHADEETYWQVNEEGDIELQLVTHQHGVEIRALLYGGGMSKRGIYFLPDEGTEGVVIWMEGDFEGDGVFVPMSGGAGAPQGFAPGKVVIVGLEVIVHDGNGGAVPLATKADVQGVTDYVNGQFNTIFGHTHTLVSGGTITTGVQEGPGSGIGPSTPGNCPDPDGTDILKGK